MSAMILQHRIAPSRLSLSLALMSDHEQVRALAGWLAGRYLARHCLKQAREIIRAPFYEHPRGLGLAGKSSGLNTLLCYVAHYVVSPRPPLYQQELSQTYATGDGNSYEQAALEQASLA